MADPPLRPDLEPDELPLDCRVRVYRLLAHLALCDGVMATRERDTLERWRSRLLIDDNAARSLEEEAAAGRQLKLGKEREERDVFVAGMLEVVAADGVLSLPEERRVEAIAAAIGLPGPELVEDLRRRLS